MSPDRIVPEKRLFRLDEVARLLDCDVRTVQRMVTAGRIAVVIVSERVRRIPRETLVRLVRAQARVD